MAGQLEPKASASARSIITAELQTLAEQSATAAAAPPHSPKSSVPRSSQDTTCSSQGKESFNATGSPHAALR